MAKKKKKKGLKKFGKILKGAAILGAVGAAAYFGGPAAAKGAMKLGKKVIKKLKSGKAQVQQESLDPVLPEVAEGADAPAAGAEISLQPAGTNAQEFEEMAARQDNGAHLVEQCQNREGDLRGEFIDEMERREFMPGSDPIDMSDQLEEIEQLEQLEQRGQESMDPDFEGSSEEEAETETPEYSSYDIDYILGQRVTV